MMTKSRVYPKRDPPAMSVAQFPGIHVPYGNQKSRALETPAAASNNAATGDAHARMHLWQRGLLEPYGIGSSVAIEANRGKLVHYLLQYATAVNRS